MLQTQSLQFFVDYLHTTYEKLRLTVRKFPKVMEVYNSPERRKYFNQQRGSHHRTSNRIKRKSDVINFELNTMGIDNLISAIICSGVAEKDIDFFKNGVFDFYSDIKPTYPADWYIEYINKKN